MLVNQSHVAASLLELECPEIVRLWAIERQGLPNGSTSAEPMSEGDGGTLIESLYPINISKSLTQSLLHSVGVRCKPDDAQIEGIRIVNILSG